jgi:dUTP pyrophosphatase
MNGFPKGFKLLGVNDLPSDVAAQLKAEQQMRAQQQHLQAMIPPLRIKKLHPEAKLPTYETQFAAGADLYADFAWAVTLIRPGGRELIKTGLAFEIPPGLQIEIRPRSGLALKNGVTVLNAPGTIDADYRGEVGVILINHGKEDFFVYRGDRIAQMVITPAIRLPFQEVTQLNDTVRGAGGFGSSGIRS